VSTVVCSGVLKVVCVLAFGASTLDPTPLPRSRPPEAPSVQPVPDFRGVEEEFELSPRFEELRHQPYRKRTTWYVPDAPAVKGWHLWAVPGASKQYRKENLEYVDDWITPERYWIEPPVTKFPGRYPLRRFQDWYGGYQWRLLKQA
jgi:hypothetical protein